MYLRLFAGLKEALGVGRRVGACQLPASVLQVLSVAVQAHPR